MVDICRGSQVKFLGPNLDCCLLLGNWINLLTAQSSSFLISYILQMLHLTNVKSEPISKLG